MRKRIKEKVLSKKDVFLFTIANLFRRATNFIFVILLARILNLETLGEYSSYTYFISLFIVVTNFGFNEFIIANSEDEKILKINFTGFFLFSLLILSVFFLIATCFNIPNYSLFLLVGIKIFLDTSLIKVLLSYFQVLKKVNKLTVSYLLSSILILIFLLVAYYFESSIYIFLIVYCIGLVILYFIALLEIKPFVKINFRKFYETNILKIKYYGLSYITVSIYMLIPNVFAALFIGKEELGIYQVAYSIANVILLVSISFIQYSYSGFLKIKCKKAFTNRLKNIIKQVFLINTIVIFFFFFFGKFILINIYGSEVFEDSWSLLMILLLANIIQSISSVLAITLIIAKLQKVKFKLNLELIILSLICSSLFIYLFQIYGVVLSFIIVYAYSFFRFAVINKNVLNKFEKFIK
ncbi:lipopolysaccharide biosynthesis protein [Formosa algae]|uniref:O-antigen/teichoic acid export membrane protein n=1 Tax=Formosa algae TaxID=225843 RepID=A0A9X0YHW8_9FLAO|nr:oligosaccharide flippase family protein [Formosa algae]MBP1838704.1 O-antigen/teichoic acid export membrane protein [Formosa algae]MDQ0335204.1 O-antigen/teichoic acid export membrane protein [Formosa algae]